MAAQKQSNYGISCQHALRLLVLVLRISTLVMVSNKLAMCMSNLPWQPVFYTLFKASTNLVVLAFNIAMGHCCLCSVFIIP